MDPQILKEAMSAYEAVYAPHQEELNELNPTPEQVRARDARQSSTAPYKSSSDNKMYKNYNDAKAAHNSRMKTLATSQAMDKNFKAGGGLAALGKGKSMGDVMKQGAANLKPKPAASAPAAKPAAPTKPAASAPAAKPAAPTKPAASAPAAKPTASGGTRPAALPSASKVEPAAKPSAMDTWAKANPRLAQAQKIRQQGGSRAEVNKSLYNKGTAAAENTPTVVKASYDMFSSSNIKGMIEAYKEVYAPIEELYKGKHGQTDDEHKDSRSNAGKMISGTSTMSGAAYSSRGVQNTGPNPAGGSKKPQGQGRMTSGQRAEMQYRKANLLKKEEVEQVDEAGKNDARVRQNIKSFRSNYTPPSNWSQSENRGKGATISPKQTEKRRRKELTKSAMGEEFDIFDVVLEFLQAEGYAETLEEAEWIMANQLDAEDIDAILGEGKKPYPAEKVKKSLMKKSEYIGYEDESDRAARESERGEKQYQIHKKMTRKEEYVDEAITSEKGKAKAAEMIANRTHASGRAKSGQGASVAAIKHISRANIDGYRGTPPNLKVAKNPVKSNFGRLDTGTGNKAARRAAALKNEEFELWVNSLVEEGYDLSGYTWDDMYEFYLGEDSATLSAAARKRAQEMGAKRRRTPEYKAGGNRGTGRNERAAYNLSNIQRTGAANPDTQTTRSKKPSYYDSGMHQGDYDRYNRKDPKKNPKHDANK